MIIPPTAAESSSYHQCILTHIIGCKAFDPVCTTDIGMLSKLQEEFSARNIFVCILCNDSIPNIRRYYHRIS